MKNFRLLAPILTLGVITMLFSCTTPERPSESLDTTVYRTVSYYADIDGVSTLVYTERVPDSGAPSAPASLILPVYAPNVSLFTWDDLPTSPVTRDIAIYGRMTYTLPVYEEEINPNSNRDGNDIRVVILSDTHYFWPVDPETGKSYAVWGIENTGPAGFTYEERAQAMVDAILAEWETEDSFDALVINGDLANNDPVFKNPLNSYPDGDPVLDKNGVPVSFDHVNTLEEFATSYIAQLEDAGIPVYVTYGGHDYVDDETWYSIFGKEKNCILKVGDVAFVLADTFDYEAHSPGDDYQSLSDLHEHFVAGTLEYVASDAIGDAYIIAHTTVNLPHFNRLTDDPHVTAILAGHTHETSVSQYRSKPVLQTGHFYFGGCFNTNNGNGMKYYVPLTNDGFAVNVAQNGIGYYELKDLVKTEERLLVGENPVKAADTPALLHIDGTTYYHFGQGTDGTNVYKRLDSDDFYYVNDDGALLRLDCFGFTGYVNTAALLFTDVVCGEMTDGNGTELFGVFEENGTAYRIYKDTGNMDFYAEKNGVFYEIESLSLVFTPDFDCFVRNSATETACQYGRGYLGVTGNPWSFRVFEVSEDNEIYTTESYIVYPAEDYGISSLQGASYGAYRQPYLRIRPSDIPGLCDRSYWKK